MMNLSGTKSEKRNILYGLGWTSLSTLINGLTQILRLSILSRFLTKEEFGIIAILTFILGLTQIFSDLGFSASIMSQKNLSRNDFLNLYWCQFAVYNIVMIAIMSLSPLIADFYQSPMLTILIPLIMLELLFISLGRLYDTVLQKNMQFKTIAIRNMVTSIASLIIAIILAVFGCGIYSLVLSTLLYTLSINVWNLFAGQAQYKLGLKKIDFKGTRKLMSVGYFQMGTQIVDYLASKLDIIIISIYLGVGELGVYNLAKELVLKFVTVINSIANKVMLPVLAQKQENITALKNTFNSFIEKLSLLNAPIVGFMIVFSSQIVQLFYGSAYLSSSDIVKILSIWSLFVVLGQPNALLAIATKKTNVSLNYSLIRLFIMAILLFSFARYSLLATSLTMLTAYLIMFLVNWRMLLKKTLFMPLSEYLGLFIRSWGFVSLIVVITLSVGLLNSFTNNIGWTVFTIAVYILMICLYYFFFERKTILSIIKKS